MKSGALCLAVAAVLTAAPARADEWVRSPPRMPAPFVLPELAHDGTDGSLDWFVGRLSTESGTVRSHALTALVRPSIEANAFMRRRMFFGLTVPIGVAMPPDGGLAQKEVARPGGVRRFAGNLEGHIRVVFPLPTWLEIGFTLGVMFPTSAFDRGYRPNRSASDAIGTLDPTSYIDFLPGRFGFRPAGDLRIRRGPVVIQGRHGLDLLVDDAGIDSLTVAGRFLAHIGYLARENLEISIEASQVYFMTSDNPVTAGTNPELQFAEKYRIKDGRRSAITLGPAVRAMTRNFDYGVATVSNLADPLSPVTSGFIGLRFSIIAHVP